MLMFGRLKEGSLDLDYWLDKGRELTSDVRKNVTSAATEMMADVGCRDAAI